MSITFTVRPDYADYKATNWLVFRKTWLSIRTLRIPLILIAIFFAINLSIYCFRCGFDLYIIRWALVESLTPAILGTIGAMVFCALCLAIQIRRTFKQLGTVEEDVEFVFSDSGFTASGETGLSKLDWKHISDFLFNPRLLILRRTSSMMYMIPVRQLGPGIAEEVVALIRAGGVRQR